MNDFLVVPLGDILRMSGYKEEKLNAAFQEFSCQRERDLENFLVSKSINYDQKGYGKTFLFLDKAELNRGKMKIAAYITLSHKAIDISNISGNKRKKMLGGLPGRDSLTSVPAYLIGQLGRDDRYSNNELPGSAILKECYYYFSKVSPIIGGELIVLECREHMYDKFYSKQGYKKLRDELNKDNLYELYTTVSFDEFITGESNN